MLQVWLQRFHCTPFHEVGIACACEFCLGNEAKQAWSSIWVISHQYSVGIDALVFPIGSK